MHDRNGTPIKVGDVVLVKAKVTSAYGDIDYCNATLSIGYEKEQGPDNVQSSVTLNSRQVVLHEKGNEGGAS